MKNTEMHKINVLKEQASVFIREIIKTGANPSEKCLTRRLYKYLSEECKFGEGLSKPQFFASYCLNPIALLAMITAFKEADHPHPEDFYEDTIWYTRNIEINDYIASLIVQNSTALNRILFNAIEQAHMSKAIELLTQAGILIDTTSGIVHLEKGDSFAYTKENAIKISIALLFFDKHGVNVCSNFLYTKNLEMYEE